MNMKFLLFMVCLVLIATFAQNVRGAATWTEEQKLLLSDTQDISAFGNSVSLDGDTALIGAYQDVDEKGSAYVFIRHSGTWTLQAELLASDGVAGDQFGYSVSLDGDTALIGARGAENNSGSVYVFTRTGTMWMQEKKLLLPDRWTHFGTAVSLDGDTALISATFENKNHGAAYVFTRTGVNWSLQGKLQASDGASMNFFGWSVALSGDTALVSAGSGVYAYIRTGTNWSEQAKILSSELSEYTNFYVSLDGDTALIGTSNRGVLVFTRTGTTWTLQQQLSPSDDTVGFDYCVSLFDDTALIGARNANGQVNRTGASYIFTRSGATWMQEAKLSASDGRAEQYFGAAVSLDETTALIGASFWRKPNTSAYVFTISGENSAPVADVTWVPAFPQVDQPVMFNASMSSDADGTLILYAWDWNHDGLFEESSRTPTTTYTWTQTGNYPVTVQVTDNNGTTHTKTITIPMRNGEDNTNGNNTNTTKKTPGFEGIVLMIAIGASAIFFMRKK